MRSPPEGKAGRWRPAKRSLGQNFLVDQNIQRKIAAEVRAQPEDIVLEVGPGHGELTKHILGSCGKLVLVEKDRELARALAERWGHRPDVEVHEADALDTDLSRFRLSGAPLRVVSNTPYNITSPLLFAFLGLAPPPVRTIVMVQLEVAKRIAAPPGTKQYGALSVGVRALSVPEVLFRVSRESFRPVPAVDSAVVRLDRRSDSPAIGQRELRAVTRACFNRRRKQLQKILRTAPELRFEGNAATFLAEMSIDPSTRPDALSPEAFVELATRLRQRARSGSQ